MAAALTVGDVAERSGVAVSAIHFYERQGLVQSWRTEGNQRRYTKAGLQRLSFIRHSRELGFPIEDIKTLLELTQHPDKPCHDAHGIAVRHLGQVQRRIAKLRRLERELKRLSQCDGDTISDCAVIETLADHGLCETDH